MGIRKAALIMEIDATRMRSGADEAVASTKRVETSAKSMSKAFEETDKKIDASFAALERRFDQMDRDFPNATAKTTDSTEKFTKSLFSAEGAGEALGRRLNSISKAGLSLFSVDILTRAIGLGSAMQAISTVSESIGNALNASLKEVIGIGDEWERSNRQLEKYVKLVEQAKERADARGSFYAENSFRNIGVSVSTNLTPYRDNQELLDRVVLARDEAIRQIAEAESEFTALANRGGQFSQGVGAEGEAIKKRAEQIKLELEQRIAQLSLEDAASKATASDYKVLGDKLSEEELKRKRLNEELRISFELRMKEADALARRRSLEQSTAQFASPFVQVGAQVAGLAFDATIREQARVRREQQLAALRQSELEQTTSDRLARDAEVRQRFDAGSAIQAERQRNQAAASFAFPFVYGAAIAGQYAAQVNPEQIERDRRISNTLTGDGRSGFTFGDNEQTADLSRQISQGLAAGIGDGIVNGDWKSAGQSVVQSIQGSLVQALVVEPFADFGAQLIKKILAALGSGVSAGQSSRQTAGNTP